VTRAVSRLAARALGRALRASGRGGTSLPGKLLLRLQPDAITRLAAGLPRGSAVISATNGKTTTTALAAAVLEAAGVATVHNVAGANMAGGVASALLERRDGAELGLFEVDEFWLDALVPALAPRAIVLGNLFRDQLDRYGELETIGDRWAALVASQPAQLVLNADDPRIADLGRERTDTLYFGIEDRAAAAGGAGLAHASDSTHCRRCGTAYAYEAAYIAHLGIYGCPGCGRARPQPQVSAHRVALDGLRGASFELRTPLGAARTQIALPGLYNVYNALGAAALASALGLEPARIAAGLAAAAAVFGRGERVAIDGKELAILLIKNPAGANEVLRLLASQPGPHDLLGILNDRIADGRDVSWIWDADFETLAPALRRATAAGTRAAELALRLKYAGVAAERIAVVPEPAAALADALAHAHGALYALPTYTAMLELRELLRRRGRVRSSLERSSP
jgi:lipid II isoglutaminyl synthase (glutamine-hydrolysing)